MKKRVNRIRIWLLAMVLLVAALPGTAMPTIAVPAVNVPANSKILHLPLDESFPVTRYLDASGNSFHGDCVNGCSPCVFCSGPFRWAIALYESRSIQIPHHTAFDFGADQDFTVMLWVNSTVPGSWASLVSNKADWNGLTRGFILSLNSDGSRWRADVSDGANRVYVLGQEVNDGRWHHLAASFYRSGDLVIYQDGAEIGRTPMAAIGDITTGNPLSIGRVGDNTYHYTGMMDDLRIYNYALSQKEIAQAAKIAGPLLHLALDESTGATTFYDSSGLHRNGACVGGSCPAAGQNGVFGGAVAFAGGNNIRIPHEPVFDFGTSQDFTVMTWMKSGDPGEWAVLVSNKAAWGGPTQGFILSINSSGQSWLVNAADGVNRLDVYGLTVNDDQWHHLAASFHRGGDLILYQNGVEVARYSMSGIGNLNSGIPLAIGRVDFGDYPYAGLLDDVRIYGYALSQEEIVRLMEGAVCTVTSDGDSGPGTLRAALEDPTCETIEFDNDYTITLASELKIYRSVVVDGGEHNIVISGNNASRVLNISGYDVTLNRLILREGYIPQCYPILDYESHWGAGIYNDGTGKTLTIKNSTITDNVSNGCPGSGISNGMVNLNLYNTLVSNNRFVNNNNWWGGGLYAMWGGPVRILNSSFTGNSSAYGSGLVNDNGSVTVINSTFSGNTSSAAVVGRGGATTTVYNTILANHSSGNCSDTLPTGGHNLADDGTCGGSFTVSGGIALGPLGWYGGSTHTFSLRPGSTAIDAGDPAHCPDSDQRGVARPQGASCDIGAFEWTCSATVTVQNADDSGDGSLRQAILEVCPGGRIDFAADATIYLSSTLTIGKQLTIDGSGHAITVSGDTDNDGSPNVRVFEINAGAAVTLSHLSIIKGLADYGGGIYNAGTVNVTHCILAGNAATGGGGLYNAGGTVAVEASTFTANTATGYGGGLYTSGGTVTVVASTLAYNQVTQSNHCGSGYGGGGLYNTGGILTVQNSTLANNTASTNCGGALYNAGTTTVRASTLSGSAANYGGGIWNASGALQLEQTIVAHSSSGYDCHTVGGTVWSVSSLFQATGANACGDGIHYGSILGIDPLLRPLADNGGPTPTFALFPNSPAIDAAGGMMACLPTDQRGVARPQGASCDIGAFEWACSAAVTVQNASDGGDGSLRQALLEVCPGGRIDFAADTTIYLGSMLTIGKSLTIDGSGRVITVSGDTGNDGTPDVRVFQINAGAVVTLSHLSIVSGTAITGGGIRNNGTLTLTHSTLSGNAATTGGGILNAGVLMAINSTLSGNAAFESGGGIANEGALTVIHSTFSDNAANLGGGIYNHVESTLNYANTLIAHSSSGGDCVNAGALGMHSHNLVQDGSCGAALSGAPLLSFLADNGGPTLTYALLPDSPALDAGDLAHCPDSDQRGVARSQGEGCDIGAYESRGFMLTQGGGSGQQAFRNTSFAQPLILTVSSAYGEPVAGGRVQFAGPGSGAGIAPITYTATISGGIASVVVTANDALGSYSVVAGARGAAPLVSYTLTNTNRPPVAQDDVFTVDEDSVDNPLDVLANDTYLPDPPEVLTIVAVGSTDQGGTVIFSSALVTYTPAPDFYGVEVFTYTISDGNGGYASATVTMTVTPVCKPVSGLLVAWQPLTPTVSQPVTWTAQANGTVPITFTWDWGDGTTASGAEVPHSYGTSGVYTVTLTAANLCGVESVTRALTVQAAAPEEHTIYLPLVLREHGGYNLAEGVRLRSR